MHLAQLPADFQLCPPLPTSKLGPSGADSWMGGFVSIQDPMGLSNGLSCQAQSLSCCLNPHRFFQSEALRLCFPTLEPQVLLPVVLPGYLHTDVRLPAPTSLDECSFFNSLVVGLTFSLIFWQFWLFFVFYICCCPFGCALRQITSTCASILARNLTNIYFLCQHHKLDMVHLIQ